MGALPVHVRGEHRFAVALVGLLGLLAVLLTLPMSGAGADPQPAP
ncbi:MULTISPECIES: hypothetical protein [unclassified Streptomyces]|nr:MULTISPECIES: hypothetical protein [unclassified Streptomyces]